MYKGKRVISINSHNIRMHWKDISTRREAVVCSEACELCMWPCGHMMGFFFFFICSIFGQNRREKPKVLLYFCCSCFSVSLGTSNLHLAAGIYKNYNKTGTLTCAWELWVKVVFHWRVLWVLMCFSYVEIGLGHTDICTGVSGTSVILGVSTALSSWIWADLWTRHKEQGETFWPNFEFLLTFNVKCVATSFCLRGR